jgi:hypothetical protein
MGASEAVEGAGGNSSGNDDALAVLRDFGGFQEFLEGVVGGRLAEWLGEATNESDKGGEVGGLAGGFVLARGNLLDPETDRGKRAGNGKGRRDAGDDGGVGFER